jgi:ribosomal-protein-serine acetyltransferase
MLSINIDDRTELRILQEEHAQELYELVAENREYLREWLGWLDMNTTLEDTREFILRSLEQYQGGDGFNAGIWFENELAGVIGFHKTDWANFKTSIGYWLGESYQGKGLMTRACRTVVDYIFSDMELNRIEIYCATDNKKSQAIPERLGFVREGILRQAEWLYDHFVDLILYSMLSEDWLQKS